MSWRFLLSLACLQQSYLLLLRGQYLFWHWEKLKEYPGQEILAAFILGIRFDLSAQVFLLLPLLLYSVFWIGKSWSKTSLFLIYFFWTLPFWIASIVDIELVQFVGRRLTPSALYLLREMGGGGGLSLWIPYWPWLLLQIAILIFFYLLVWSFAGGKVSTTSGKRLSLRELSLRLGLLLVAVVLARGGLQKKPLSYTQAQVSTNTWMNLMVLNTPFSFVKGINKKTLVSPKTSFSESQVRDRVNFSRGRESVLQSRPLGPTNVVLLIMESFALEYLSKPEDSFPPMMPFLEELGRKSLFLTTALANGRRSIEALSSLWVSVPSYMDQPFIASEFASMGLRGLVWELKSRGYGTSFFHGAENGSMHFDSFSKSAGIDQYFGAREYPNSQDHDGAWGIYDEPFFKFFQDQLNAFQEPFFSTFFSLSSHPPYVIPEGLRSEFPEGPLEISQSLRYSDRALKQFFLEAQKQDWFKRTLFVITADHTQKGFRKEFDNPLGRHRVPLLFFYEGYLWPQKVEGWFQHIDVGPSILDFLGFEEQQPVGLARSIFRPGPRTATLFLEPGFLVVSGDHALKVHELTEQDGGELFEVTENGMKSVVGDPRTSIVFSDLNQDFKASLQYFSEGLRAQKYYLNPGSPRERE